MSSFILQPLFFSTCVVLVIRVRVPTAFSFNPFEIKNLEWELPLLGNSRNVAVKRLPSTVRNAFSSTGKPIFSFFGFEGALS